MQNQPFPSDVSEWTWDTIQALADSKQSETLYLEYKRHLQYPETNPNKSKKEWKRDLEREFTAFANAGGGIIVFGMNDDVEPTPFSPPEHEISREVSQLIQKTNPPVKTDISEPLAVPSEGTDRVVLAVRVYEANRKPVATSDSAYYARINDQKQPMNREQIESQFIKTDRQQQATRQLEAEINRFHEIFNKDPSHHFDEEIESPPDYHILNIESIKEVLRENTHLYSDEDVNEAIARVFREIRGIEYREIHFNRAMAGHASKRTSTNEQFFKKERKEFNKRVRRLERGLKALSERADLQVKLLDND